MPDLKERAVGRFERGSDGSFVPLPSEGWSKLPGIIQRLEIVLPSVEAEPRIRELADHYAITAPRMAAVLDRLFANIVKTASGCWEWQGAKAPRGYPRTGIMGRHMAGHRLALMYAVGIPSTYLYALHSCDNPPCLNPEHLQWGTLSDNTVDSVAKRRWHWTKKTHCPQGHPYDEENTYVHVWRGKRKRLCKTCTRERNRINSRKRRARQLLSQPHTSGEGQP